MAKCQSCHQGINSTYIRTGSKGSLKKIGHYCCKCNVHYNMDKKLYTVNEKLYTVSKYNQNIATGAINKNSNTTSNNDNNTTISNPNTQKLYKRTGDNQLKRVRSVVRISRQSSEPLCRVAASTNTPNNEKTEPYSIAEKQ